MGATLFLTPATGYFDLDQIKHYLEGVPGLVEADDTPHFISFCGDPAVLRVRRALDLRNKQAAEHRRPYLRYTPLIVEFGINWTDTPTYDGRRFLDWLMATFECNGCDDEGFVYQGSSACRKWIAHWLSG